MAEEAGCASDKDHIEELLEKKTTAHNGRRHIMPQEGLEPPTCGLAYHYSFHCHTIYVCGLDYIFTISGATRIVSTESTRNHRQSEPLALDYSWMRLPAM